ncbi:hypothetical protein HIO71_17960 [Chryseobacterium aquaticum]|uniref:Outer membrane protein beta-barrel domain-containing protein n=1 Tax=Chryseobacterium aquaticum TaxID=452084 RepID=A0A848NBE0_9FLAO|nr:MULTISPECIES: hypothetical protein [Chryseobacterium]NMR36068.1 hypothetical protein [Chryseobacterium aquaticum]NRQ48127.1 hypothetical protein [Chryseobacterium sp. C-204]
MKTLTTSIVICVFAFSTSLMAQHTKVLKVDLSSPDKDAVTFREEENTTDNSKVDCKESYTGKGKEQEIEKEKCTKTESHRWLSVRSGDLIAMKLVNGNPLKYNYRVNGAPVTLFMNTEGINALKIGAEEKAAEVPKEEYDEPTYKELPAKNIELKENLEKLDLSIDKFELIYSNKESLGNDFVKERDLLFDLVKNLHYEAEKNKSCFEAGEKKYPKSLSDDAREKARVDVKFNFDKATAILSNFEGKFFFPNEFYTLPMEHQGKNIDAIEFTVKRINKTNNSEDENFSSKYKVWITGGLKIDISAGIFLTSLFDDVYETKDGTDAAKKMILKKNAGKYDFAVGSTINTGFRINSWVQPNLNFGFIFTQNQKFQLALGLGLVLGKEERWILSGGLTMGVVDRLRDGYNDGGQYSLGADGQIPMVKQFKFGHFFGITYNLSKVNTISFK